MATARIYNLENKIDGSNTLVKAETKAQVNALIRNSFVITAIGAVEVLEMVEKGAKVMDATSLDVGSAEALENTPPGSDSQAESHDMPPSAPLDDGDPLVP